MYEKIPSVDALAKAPLLAPWAQRLGWKVVVNEVREVLGELRDAVARNELNGFSFELSSLAQRVAERLESSQRPLLASAINATGIILHTGLGRSPLAREAAAALSEIAQNYAAVELDLTSGQRGKRSDIVRKMLCDITGAQSATVVNNNAAATMLVLATIARGRSVIVSRGELIEIGGSFRLPDVMEAGGARLREVGTTNRTRLADYDAAIDDSVAALMKVHTSNYRIEGFTESGEIDDLVKLAQRRNLPVIHDVGSGLLRAMPDTLLSDEPDASSSIAAGADLVLFSGDKLLGGPQCGIIIGRSKWIDLIEKNPLARAMRVDKLTLAALGATLRIHRDPGRARRALPLYQMLDATIEQLEDRAARIASRIRGIGGIDVARSVAYLGGGSMPNRQVPSVAVRICPKGSIDDLARRLRTGVPPVIGRIQQDQLWLDLRTIMPSQDEMLVQAIQTALGGH